jgi:hypothetical protein
VSARYRNLAGRGSDLRPHPRKRSISMACGVQPALSRAFMTLVPFRCEDYARRVDGDREVTDRGWDWPLLRAPEEG